MAETKNAEVSEAAPSNAQGRVRVPLHDPVTRIFADGCHGANVIAGCVRLDLYSLHAWAGSEAPQQMVSGRLIIPLERFKDFASSVNVVLQQLQSGKTAPQETKAKPAKP